MKYNVETLSPSQWLDIVNREEDVSQEAFSIRYLKVGNQYFAYSNTSVGKILTPAFVKDKFTEEELEKIFDKATVDIEAEFKAKSDKKIGVSFIKNPMTPGL